MKRPRLFPTGLGVIVIIGSISLCATPCDADRQATYFAQFLGPQSLKSAEEAAGKDRLQVVGQLQPGTIVRMNARELGRIEGSYLRVVGDTLFVSVKRDYLIVPVAIEIDSMNELWVRRNRSKGKWGNIGGIAGLIVGGVAGGVSCEGEDRDCFGAEVGGALVGIVVGAGVGMILAELFPRWEKKYP